MLILIRSGAAFAVQFDEQKPGHVIALKELLGHSRVETRMVYLRRKDRAKVMEAVRDLSSERVTTLCRSAPSGIRTRATALKGPRPRPLVDGGGATEDSRLAVDAQTRLSYAGGVSSGSRLRQTELMQ
jgi:hypothetical protein